MTAQDDIVMSVGVSPGRRILGLGCIWLLAAILIYLAFFTAPALEWRLFLLVCGAAALWAGRLMQRATALGLELTEEVLRDTSGAVLARIDDIERLDRSVFAFKPSNGFVLVLRTRRARGWVPGLWWQTGRRVGVGGMTRAPQTKAMAEVISAMLLKRDGAV